MLLSIAEPSTDPAIVPVAAPAMTPSIAAARPAAAIPRGELIALTVERISELPIAVTAPAVVPSARPTELLTFLARSFLSTALERHWGHLGFM